MYNYSSNNSVVYLLLRTAMMGWSPLP